MVIIIVNKCIFADFIMKAATGSGTQYLCWQRERRTVTRQGSAVELVWARSENVKVESGWAAFSFVSFPLNYNNINNKEKKDRRKHNEVACFFLDVTVNSLFLFLYFCILLSAHAHLLRHWLEAVLLSEEHHLPDVHSGITQFRRSKLPREDFLVLYGIIFGRSRFVLDRTTSGIMSSSGKSILARFMPSLEERKENTCRWEQRKL